MISERILELINADIDGELRPEDRPELEAALESSEQARTLKSELQKLTNIMDGLPQQEPPQKLRNQLFDSIRLPRQNTSFSLSSWFSSFQPATAGFAFAAGLLMAVGFYEFSSERVASGDSASMVGTMVAGKSTGAELMQNDMLLKGDGFTGTISLRERSGIYVLNFDLDSETSTEVKVGLDSTGYAFGGFAEIQSDENRVFESVTMSGGALRVVNQGRQQFAIFLRENGAGKPARPESISIDFSSSDRL